MRELKKMRPSALIRLALADLEQAEAADGYQIDMNNWHIWDDENDVCSVCLAGAVIAFSLDGKRGHEFWPDDFYKDGKPTRTADYLRALDYFRVGALWEGLTSMEQEPIDQEIAVVPYEDDPAEFKRDMLEIVTRLEGAGL